MAAPASMCSGQRSFRAAHWTWRVRWFCGAARFRRHGQSIKVWCWGGVGRGCIAVWDWLRRLVQRMLIHACLVRLPSAPFLVITACKFCFASSLLCSAQGPAAVPGRHAGSLHRRAAQRRAAGLGRLPGAAAGAGGAHPQRAHQVFGGSCLEFLLDPNHYPASKQPVQEVPSWARPSPLHSFLFRVSMRP